MLLVSGIDYLLLTWLLARNLVVESDWSVGYEYLITSARPYLVLCTGSVLIDKTSSSKLHHTRRKQK